MGYNRRRYRSTDDDLWVQVAGFAVCVVVAIVIGAVFVHTNYTGEGQRFDVTVKVTAVSDQSITGQVVKVNHADIPAASWVQVGEEQEFHDNYRGDEFWDNEHTVGVVTGVDGTVINVHGVHVGDYLHVTGALRDSDSGKSYQTRAVFETAQIQAR